jgi:hypothetical protein
MAIVRLIAGFYQEAALLGGLFHHRPLGTGRFHGWSLLNFGWLLLSYPQQALVCRAFVTCGVFRFTCEVSTLFPDLGPGALVGAFLLPPRVAVQKSESFKLRWFVAHLSPIAYSMRTLH